MKTGITNAKGGGKSNTLLTTTTDATETSGVYTLALTNFSDTPKVNDYVVFVDSGNLTTLYQVSVIGSTEATLIKIGDVSGSGGGGGTGTPLYEHNVKMHTSSLQITLTIINASNTALDKDSINSWLSNNGYTGASPNYESYNLGFVYSTNNDKLASQGVAYRSGTTFSYKNILGSWVGINNSDITFDYDKIQELGTASINGGGGSQLYQHNIKISGSVSGISASLCFTIINDSNLPFVKHDAYIQGTNVSMQKWLYDNGFIYQTDYYQAIGGSMNSDVYKGISADSYYYFFAKHACTEVDIQLTNTTLTDKITAL